MPMRQIKPPRFAQGVLRLLLPDCEAQSMMGDLEEAFVNLCRREGTPKAKRWYYLQMCRALPSCIRHRLLWKGVSMRNTFITWFRLAKRQKLFTAINTIGLTLGLTTATLIFLFVYYETGFDGHHENADRIYRITTENREQQHHFAGAPYLLQPLVKEQVPEVAEAARMKRANFLVIHGGDTFKEVEAMLADNSLFSLFSLPLVQGNPDALLSDPHSVVLSQRAARKYFGDEDPLGQVLNVRKLRGINQYDETVHACRVTGVMENLPRQSHFQTDHIFSMAAIDWGYEHINRKRAIPAHESWQFYGCYTYLLLHPSSTSDETEESLARAIQNTQAAEHDITFHLQPLTDIHLSGGEYTWEMQSQVDGDRVALFTLIASLILVIAILNTLILSTAQASRRVREVSIRKITGARPGDLIRQVLGESVMTALITLPVVLILTFTFLPAASDLLNAELTPATLFQWPFLLGLVGMCLITGSATGIYLAARLSGIPPVQSLSTRYRAGGKTGFRNILIAFQLVVFLILSVLAGTVYRQVHYLFGDLGLGFDPRGVVSVKIKDDRIRNRFDALKRDLLSHPAVKAVSCSFSYGEAYEFSAREHTKVRHKTLNRSWWQSGMGGSSDVEVLDKEYLAFGYVDPDFLDVMKLELVQGRSFDPSIASDRAAIVVNEAFLKAYDISDPIGREVEYVDEKRRIVGVFRDFHTMNIYEPVPPLVLKWKTQLMNHVNIRIDPVQTPRAVAHIRDVWHQYCPDFSVDIRFLETAIESHYKYEMRFGKLMAVFAGLAMVISVMGLWGLAAFIAVQKTREISIRKVLGASPRKIIAMMSNSYVILVLIANAIALPVAWHLSQKWLEQYAYRIHLSPMMFAAAGIISLVVTLAAVNLHVLHVARQNPVKALRVE